MDYETVNCTNDIIFFSNNLFYKFIFFRRSEKSGKLFKLYLTF